MSDRAQWSRAYAVQAAADFRAYECLLQVELVAGVPRSEALHFLQMAVEKFVKAHLYLTESNPEHLQSTHGVIAKHLPTIVKRMHERYEGRQRPSGSTMKHVRAVAAEIHCLHPQNNAGGSRPDNCEYPWEDKTGGVRAPAEHSFEGLTPTRERWWMDLVKMLKAEMARLSAEAT